MAEHGRGWIVAGARHTDSLARGRAERRNAVAPELLVVRRDHVELADGRLACTLAVTEFPRAVDTCWLAGLLQFSGEYRVSQHVEPIGSSEALVELDRDLRASEASQLLAHLRGAHPDARDGAAADDAAALREEVARGSIRLFRHQLLITVFGDDRDDLDRACAALTSLLEGAMMIARHQPLQQLAGLASTMPIGRCGLECARNFDSDALAASVPFGAGEMQSRAGELWGLDAHRATPVCVDRRASSNPHLVVLGGSGSGKSFWIKHLLTQELLGGGRVAVLDPQGEYEPWCQAVGGRFVRPEGRPPHSGGAPTSPSWVLDPLLPPPDAGGGGVESWRTLRLQRAVGLLELLGGPSGAVDPELVWGALEAVDAAGEAPSLHLLARLLAAAGPRGEVLARRLQSALRAGLPVAGPPAMDGGKALQEGGAVVFDLRSVVRQPAPLAAAAYMLLTQHLLDHFVGPARGCLTLAIDEAHHLFAQPVAARFVEVLFRTGRKTGVSMVMATQSASDLVGNSADPDAARAARAALANAGFALLMRQQNGIEAGLLRDLYRIDGPEADWLLQCRRGEGLVVAGASRLRLKIEAPEALIPLFSTDPAAAPRPP